MGTGDGQLPYRTSASSWLMDWLLEGLVKPTGKQSALWTCMYVPLFGIFGQSVNVYKNVYSMFG